MSLVDIHSKLASYDEVLEKEASVEFEKLAEEDAAGRIMARGFMDELIKMADWPSGATFDPGPGETYKTKPGYSWSMPAGGAGPGVPGANRRALAQQRQAARKQRLGVAIAARRSQPERAPKLKPERIARAARPSVGYDITRPAGQRIYSK